MSKVNLKWTRFSKAQKVIKTKLHIVCIGTFREPSHIILSVYITEMGMAGIVGNIFLPFSDKVQGSTLSFTEI